jgi:hypothetical protein
VRPSRVRRGDVAVGAVPSAVRRRSRPTGNSLATTAAIRRSRCRRSSCLCSAHQARAFLSSSGRCAWRSRPSAAYLVSPCRRMKGRHSVIAWSRHIASAGPPTRHAALRNVCHLHSKRT